MDFVQICPQGDIRYVDKFILSVQFDKEELLSMGMTEDQDELSDLYIDKDEFTKLYDLWKDPSYLDDFFDRYQDFFKDDYWTNTTKARFISDVTSSAPLIFREIVSLFNDDKLEEAFKPLDRVDKKKESFTSIRVKSKFGVINHHVAFRIYAIKIEDGCYVITGGTIKLTREMLKAPNTAIELKKLNYVYKECGTYDDRSSFIEFILE